jgi:hypothetical protein
LPSGPPPVGVALSVAPRPRVGSPLGRASAPPPQPAGHFPAGSAGRGPPRPFPPQSREHAPRAEERRQRGEHLVLAGGSGEEVRLATRTRWNRPRTSGERRAASSPQEGQVRPAAAGVASHDHQVRLTVRHRCDELVDHLAPSRTSASAPAPRSGREACSWWRVFQAASEASSSTAPVACERNTAEAASSGGP